MRRHDLAGCQQRFDGATLSRRALIFQVHRHLGGAAPFRAQTLQIGGHEQKPAKDEQGERDRQSRQEAGLPPAPEAANRFVQRIAKRAHSSRPYELTEYYSQRAFDRDFRAATTERPGSEFEKTTPLGNLDNAAMV